MPTKKQIHAVMKAMGRLGGLARKKALTPERRKEIARNAVRARWAKQKAKTK